MRRALIVGQYDYPNRFCIIGFIKCTVEHLFDYYGNVLKWNKPLRLASVSDKREQKFI